MKATSWTSAKEFFTSRMLVQDRNERTIFFPWGARSRRGYILRNLRQKSQIAGFYTAWVIAYFSSLFVLEGFVHGFTSLVEVLVVCSGLWLFTWYVYARTITKSLPAARQSYADIVLEKLSQDASEYVESKTAHSQEQKSQAAAPAMPAEKDFLLPLKAIYYELSPGQLASASWIIMFLIAGILLELHPSIFAGELGSYLAVALLTFFAGLGFFFIFARAQTS